jgi:hypothetical protein
MLQAAPTPLIPSLSAFLSVCSESTRLGSLSWHRSCIPNLQFMRLASRGGRNSTSTEFSVMGGQINTEGGLHRPPFYFCFLILRVSPFRNQTSPSRLENLVGAAWRRTAASQKSERPVGVPAALAWGMEGLQSEAQFSSRRDGCSAALASTGTTPRSKIVTIVSARPEENLTSDNVCECASSKARSH